LAIVNRNVAFFIGTYAILSIPNRRQPDFGIYRTGRNGFETPPLSGFSHPVFRFLHEYKSDLPASEDVPCAGSLEKIQLYELF